MQACTGEENRVDLVLGRLRETVGQIYSAAAKRSRSRANALGPEGNNRIWFGGLIESWARVLTTNQSG
jgi:hypothetical protein